MRLIRALVHLDSLTEQQLKFILRYLKTRNYVVLPSNSRDTRTARNLVKLGYLSTRIVRSGWMYWLVYFESDREELATWRHDGYATPEDCEMDWIRYDRRNAGDTGCVFPANMLLVSLRG
jgi:hypothetical protein